MYHTNLAPVLAVLVMMLVSFCHGDLDCSSPPPGSCAFYAECLESKYHCGTAGYPIGYGQKFCEVFEREADKFSPSGQEFLWNNMQCLQRSLVAPFIHNNTLSDCETLKQTALDSHPSCYIESGYCDIPAKDKFLLAKIVLKNDITGIFWSSVKLASDVSKRCISEGRNN
ncbi:hypothetical protein BCR42DRAFT_424660 [Absidia repens]|uniref:Uncharacterized protein n=1 Tax=Absidia repens TaxID=90262 RepID=A0A1X2I3N7_9FUNG|nr:hypothetical protein BCR42DRAFT_424660 [Absidia repens]